MNDLINLVAQKTGISPEQAKTAAETVIGYLKDKLPAPLAGQLDGVLGSGGEGAPSMGDAIKNLRANLGGS